MKRIIVLLTVLALLAIPCFAAEDYYVHDGPDWLSDTLEAQLCDRAAALYEQTDIDYLIVIADDAGEKTGSEYAYDYYYNSPCAADALVLYIDSVAMKANTFAYGTARDRYSDETLSALTDTFIELYQKNDNYAPIFTGYLDAAVDAAGVTETAAGEPVPTRPDWYPQDVSAFVDFHAVNPPHVVDDADIFTDEQEAAMSAKIAEIIAKTGRDLVVFTDSSSYGLSRNIYAADFYQFRGYGVGNDFSGSVLLICMEPGNRGWYTAVCGEAQNILTYKQLNAVDDLLEPYMKSGSYYDGTMNYLDNIATIYRTGKAPQPFPFMRLLVCLAVAAVIALVSTGMMKSGMKTVKAAAAAENYLIPGSFDLRKSHDIFLYRTVTRVKREKSSGSGGGGGSYSSSGGRSFSGSGRSF